MADGQRTAAVYLDTIGCKLNQADTELLARQFADAGYRLAASAGEADVYILNTCTVTHVADGKCRRRLRMVRRRNPGALIIATGCYAERAPEEVARAGGVDLVIGTGEKSDLVRAVAEAGRAGAPAVEAGYAAGKHTGRTRAFIKAQDGCNSPCAYCIVPLVRGGERSISSEEVVAGVRDRVDGNYKEVVLTGTKIGSYHHDGADLTGLLRRILAETGVSRLRVSSLQPREITPELIGLWSDERLCPHCHLSLQSGSDSVLERMKRRYSTADYRQAVSLIREGLPEAAITTDIIAGFPGETDREFEDSFSFCRQLEFARIHVFPYSLRSGTEAAGMPPVAEGAKRRRAERMLSLAGESALNFRRGFLGRTMAVLWEKQSAGVWSGLTGNYIKVYARSSEDLTNRLLPVKLVDIRGDGVWGEV